MLSLFSVNVVFVKLAIGCVGGWVGGWVGGCLGCRVILAEYKEWLGRAIKFQASQLDRIFGKVQ